MEFDVKDCPMNHEEKKIIVVDRGIETARIEYYSGCGLVLNDEVIHSELA